MKRLMAAASLVLALAACNDQYASSGRSIAPIPMKTMALMSEKGMAKSDPILVRLYKKESELEIWKKAADGRYAHLKTYPICRWSGQLGPKTREGDRQAPEGFYTVTPGLMNPNSAYYLSFDTGYPNAYDRSLGRTGSQLMVHGTCSSRGCYAMTDEGIAEVYALAREAFSAGQKGFQFQAYPFRMTAENLAKFRRDPNMSFWANLKEGSDHFEVTRREPKVAVCSGKYAFDTVGNDCAPDPALAPAIAEKAAEDRRAVAELVAKGVPAVKVVYADGGGHETFRLASIGSATGSDAQFSFTPGPSRASLGDVSRPDALAAGPREIALDDAKPNAARSTTLLAAAVKRTPGSKLAATTAATDEVAEPAAPAKRIVVASADGAMPVAASAPSASPTDKPFYERMIATVTGRSEPVEAPPTAPVPEAVPPAPPRRQAAVDAKKPAAPKKVEAVAPKADGKTDAKAEAKPHPAKPASEPAKPGKQAATIPGATSVGPVATAFRLN